MRFKNLFFALLMLFISFPSNAENKSALDVLNREIAYLNYNKSAKLAEQVRSKSKVGSDEWLKSTLALAISLHQCQPDVKSEKNRAAKIYQEIIDNSNGKPIQAKAMLLLARFASERDYMNDKPDNAKARELYSRIIKEFPDSKLADAAALFKAQLDIYSTNKAEILKGIDFTLDWIKKRPTNLFTSLQYQLIARAYYRDLNDPLKSIEYDLEAEKIGLPPLTQLDYFYWNVANMAEISGQTNIAVKYYKKVITDVVSSGFAYESQIRLKELGITPPELVDPFAEAVE
ncbi:tetratricopeptide repeat protein [bacterium]|nr:tetratricopeptide repeat protein [bacterium]